MLYINTFENNKKLVTWGVKNNFFVNTTEIIHNTLSNIIVGIWSL